MALRYLAGLAANLSTTGTIGASSEDANYPKERVAVGIPGKTWRAATAAADDWIGVDLGSDQQPTLFSIHGHNLDSGITVKIQSATNPTFTTGVVTHATVASPASPSFYVVLTSAPTARRYWRFLFEGTNGTPIEVGEMVVGVAKTLTRAQQIDWSYDEIQPQSRTTGGLVPEVRAENLTDLPQRRLNLTFLAESYAQRDELRDEFIRASKYGAEPIVIIPDENDELVIHGRVPNRLTWRRLPGQSGGDHETTIAIDEDPFWLSLA